jgi:hypothetical protein
MSKARDLANAGTALTSVSATELGYVDGVTSAIQTQLDTKLATTTASSTYIPKTLTTTTGDIIYASAANTPARLGIGSTDQILKVTGGVPVWATPAASGSMTLLSTTNTTSGVAIAISGISQSYKALKIVGLNINRAGTADVRIYPCNGGNPIPCSGTYFYHTNGPGEIYPYDAIYATANNGQVSTSYPMYFELDIFNYASTTLRKTFKLNGAFSRSGLTPARYVAWNVSGVVDGTSAIDSLNVYSDQAFNAGQILVYGVN